MESQHTIDEKGEDVRKIKKNIMLIVVIFKKTMHMVDPRIQEGLNEMYESLEEISLKDALEQCLDTFCQFVAIILTASLSRKESCQSNT